MGIRGVQSACCAGADAAKVVSAARTQTADDINAAYSDKHAQIKTIVTNLISDVEMSSDSHCERTRKPGYEQPSRESIPDAIRMSKSVMLIAHACVAL